jgi:hypothetical protein
MVFSYNRWPVQVDETYGKSNIAAQMGLNEAIGEAPIDFRVLALADMPLDM